MPLAVDRPAAARGGAEPAAAGGGGGLGVWCGTFNAGNQPPPPAEDLRDWLAHGASGGHRDAEPEIDNDDGVLVVGAVVVPPLGAGTSTTISTSPWSTTTQSDDAGIQFDFGTPIK